MGSKKHAILSLLTIAFCFLFVGCGDAEFGSSMERRSSEQAALIGDGGSDQADGDDGSDGDDALGEFGEGGGEDGLAGGGSDEDGDDGIDFEEDEFSAQRCVYFVEGMEDSEEVEHIIKGGPPIAINLTEYTEGGKWKGDTYEFRIQLYRLHYATGIDNLGIDDIYGNIPLAGGLVNGIVNGPGAWHLDKPQGATSQMMYEEWFEVKIKDAKSGSCYAIAEYQEVDPVEVKAWHDARFGGCFAAETQIQLADGSLKAAEDIVAGDMTRNPLTGEVSPIVKVTMAEKRAGRLYHIRIGDQELAVTGNHPFLTVRGVKKAEQLVVTDRLVVGLNNSQPIVSIRTTTPVAGTFVYNFEMAPKAMTASSHILSANGIPSGDLWLQESNLHFVHGMVARK